MRKIKALILMTLIIMILNLIIPNFSLAVEIEEIQNNESIKSDEKIPSKRELTNKMMKNEEFSLYIMDDVNKINLYEKNGKSFLFVPKFINLSEMIIYYTGNVESVDNAELDKETKSIRGIFKDESSFTIELSDGQTKNIIIMQSDLPSMYINLESDITLDTVNRNGKEIKYNATVDIKNDNNIIQANAEFKGRGNYTWYLPKKSYQIKFNKNKVY